MDLENLFGEVRKICSADFNIIDATAAMECDPEPSDLQREIFKSGFESGVALGIANTLSWIVANGYTIVGA